jgi:hypothetical protein
MMMTKLPPVVAAALWIAPALWGQTATGRSEEADRIELYTQAIASLVGPQASAGAFSVASRLGAEGGRLIVSEIPEVVVARLAEAGYDAELAELAENGLWQVPRGTLFVILREIEFWPGRKIAVFNIDVGSPKKLEEVAFKFRKEEDVGWVLIEKGPAENEG